METLATSYVGFSLLLQFPFSLLAAIVSLIFAVGRFARWASVSAATVALLLAGAGIGREFRHYGWTAFESEHALGTWIMLSPAIVALGVIVFARSNTQT